MQCRKKKLRPHHNKIASLLLFITFVDVTVQNPTLVVESVYFQHT